MKQNKIKLPAVLFAGLSLMGMSGAQASSELASSAKITFTIDNISNLTQPGLINPVDLGIFGSFEQDGSSYAYLNGDASINDNNPSELSQFSSLPELIFSHTFAINGSANDGSLESYHLGFYGLSLYNNGLTDTYTVDLGFSYLLSASAAGQNADTDVSIDYFSDEDLSFVGSDYVTHSNIFGFPVSTANNSGTFSITLAPGAAGFYLADVVINGNLTAAPVPLPAAAWLFLAGLLGILGVKKRNNPAAQME